MMAKTKKSKKSKNSKTKKSKDDNEKVIIQTHRHPVMTTLRWMLTILIIVGIAYSGWYGWQFKQSYDFQRQATYFLQTQKTEDALKACSMMTINSVKCYDRIVAQLVQKNVPFSPEICERMDLNTLAYWERTAATKTLLQQHKQECTEYTIA